MKSDQNVSRFLHVTVKKTSKKDSTSVKSNCEVVAIGPASKSPSFNLHNDFKDYKPLIDQLNDNSELSTKFGASCLVRFASTSKLGRGSNHVLVVGTGHDGEGINALGPVERFRRLGAVVAQKLSAEKQKEATVYFDSFFLPSAQLNADAENAAYAFCEGMGLTTYRFDKYFSNSGSSKKEEPLQITLATAQESKAKAYSRGWDRAQAMLLGASLCRDFGNEPSNELYPEEYARRARALGADYGLKCTVFDEKNLVREKMGLLLGVGQGSVKPPRLILLEYKPRSAKKTIAFVGKGITFDSGGISIKPSAKMEDMKHDMCGSAAVLGAIVAAARLKLNVHILVAIAAAENMPSGNAIQPGNILVSRPGKTVEITNTDAEGRLVLADALDYVQDMKPDYIIDLATLTGAATITLGKTCSGLMGNDTAFNRMVHAAAKASGERVWELPLYEEYFDDLKSEFADMRNSGDSPSHGTAKGAMFLKQFIRKGTRWAHLDIASVAYAVPTVPYYPRKASSGYGVRLLVELAKGLANV